MGSRRCTAARWTSRRRSARPWSGTARSTSARRRGARGVVDALRAGDLAAAARRALDAADLPVALRLARASGDLSLRRAVASRVGAAATLTDARGATFARWTLGPAAEDNAQAVLRRLGEWVDRSRSEVGRDGESVRAMIVRAIRLARRGDAVDAVRIAVRALSLARREGDAAGERASLAMIADLLGVLGERDGARAVLAAMDAP